jgi:GPH family glycoside/pentoside/hexuronide:cation symporter
MIETSAQVAGSQAPPRLSLRVKVLYGVGDLVSSVKMTLFGLFVFFFYTTVMGLPASLVGLAAGLGLIWDAVIDPAIGHASDRSRLRFGRRHSFMLVGAATTGMAFWALFSPPPGLTTEMLFAWYLATNLLVRLATSVFLVPYYALGAELSRDYEERTSITGVRGGCALIGGLAASGLSFVLFFPNVVAEQDPKLDYNGYPALGLTFGLLMSIAALVATLGTLPWRTHLPHARPDGGSTSDRLLTTITSSLRNEPFRALFISFSLVFLGSVISSTLSLHFVTYYVKITDSGTLSMLQLMLYGGAIVSIPVWLALSRVVEKRSLYLLGALTLAVVWTSAFLLVGEGRPFGTGDVRPLLLGNIVVGLATGIFWTIPPSMLADVVDAHALVRGQRREGSLFGVFSFGQQVATGFAVLVAGVLIERFAGLAPGEVPESNVTIERIGMLSSLIPAALALIGAFWIRRYPLDRRRVEAIQKSLVAE